MKIKELLYRHSGKFDVYENMYDASGQWIGCTLIADHETNFTDEIKDREVQEYSKGKNYLIIYV